MEPICQDWLDRYRCGLVAWITHHGSVCEDCDRLGRLAASQHHVPADVVTLHKQVLAELLRTCDTAEQATQLALRANDYLGYCLNALMAEIVQIQKWESYYRQTVDHSPNPIFIVDRQGHIQFWNHACEQMFQYGQEFCGESVQQLLPDRHAHEVMQAILARAFAGEVLSNIELVYQAKNGDRRFMISRLYPARDESGDIQRCVVANTDVTDRQQTETALQTSEARFQRLAKNVAGVIYQYVTYPDGSDAFTYVSPRLSELYEVDVEVVLQDAQVLWNLVHPEDVPALKASILAAIQNQQVWSHEHRMITPSGQLKWIHTTSRPDFQPDGTVIWDGMTLDISDRKQAEAALQQLNEDLEARIQRRTTALQIANQQLHHREEILRQQASQEQLLRRLTQDIRQSLELDQILKTVVTEVRETFQADRALIFHLTSTGSGVVLQEHVAPDYLVTETMLWENECFPPDCYEYYCQGIPRIVNDIQTDHWGDCLVEFMTEAAVQSKLVAPIIQHAEDQPDRIWGLLIVHACATKRQWQPPEAELLQQIADQLAISIQQAQLYQTAQAEIADRQRAETQLQYQADADRLLAEIVQIINQSFQLDDLLMVALEKVRAFLQVDRVVAYRFELDGSGVIELEAVSQPALSLLGQVFEDPCFNLNYADRYYQGHVSAVDDTHTAPLIDCYAKFLAQLQIRANLVVPILATNQLWGLLLAHQCHTPRPWQTVEIELLKQVALQIGIASQKSKLYNQLEQELRQKELLLKEVHHRVKNNLQVMSAMLKLQAKSRQDPLVISALEDSRSRLRAIALTHEILYQSTNLEQLDFWVYIRKLTEAILAANSIYPNHIQVHYDLQPISLNLDTAIPCGLLLNEVITNAIKHAFPDGRSGDVFIGLKNLMEISETCNVKTDQSTQSDGRYVLSIRDNGIGIADDLDPKALKSLGLRIIYDLALQLRGTLELIRSQGTEFRLTFSELRYRNRF